MLDEGDSKVMDESIKEEHSTSAPTKADEPTQNSNSIEVADKALETKESTGDPQPVTVMDTDSPSLCEAAKEPDFTMDIAIDGSEVCPILEEQAKPLLTVDRLDASEPSVASEPPVTVDLTAPTSEDGVKTNNEKTVENESEVESVVELISPENAWYEEKLNAKTTIVKERLSKLGRFLVLSYPQYLPWLQQNPSSICHLDPPRRCPLDKPHTNRWKFICSRKTVQETTNKEEGSAEGTVDKKLETVWRLGPTDGSGVNTDNAAQYPPFVMRVVKVFEEFIQSIENSTNDESPSQQEASTDSKPIVDGKEPAEIANKEESTEKKQDSTTPNRKAEEDVVVEETTNDETRHNGDRSHNWLWLLVRSNSKDELMVFATGKKISEATMQKLKETFESGPGKDCNVKSLYCKSIFSKNGNTSTSNITFLGGVEALDECVGGLKIQLAPKTNFWCNASGVEQLGAVVGDMLSPLKKTTIVEVGCGLGLIGLMLAPKSKKVIGLDAPSEVEEAEMTSELNKIENASFIMGQPTELMTKVAAFLKNSRAAAIVNGNTKLGRDIEVMTALRKIPSLRRVAMITTLTKQSVRAILELTRPAEGDLGNPFMPLRATLVDTLPTGPHFEVVIRMERLNMQKISEPWFWDHVKFRAGLSPNEQPRKNPPAKSRVNKTSVPAKRAGIKVFPGGNNKPNAAMANRRSNKRNKMKKQKPTTPAIVLGAVTGVVRNPPGNIPKNATGTLVRNPLAVIGKSTLKAKTALPTDESNAPQKPFNNKVSGPQSSTQLAYDSPASPDPLRPVKVAKSSKAPSTSAIKRNPLARVQPARGQRLSGAQRRKRHWAMIEAQRHAAGVSVGGNQGPSEKRMRSSGNQGDLRGRLSDSRPIQPLDEQQILPQMIQQRLTGQSPMVDADTAKQLQNMLNIVLDQTNKLQNQLPRSVWDRIAPPDNFQSQPQEMSRNSNMLRDRCVQNVGPQGIAITTENRQFSGTLSTAPLFNSPTPDRSKILPAGICPVETQGGLRNQHTRVNSGRGRDNRINQGNDWNSVNQFDKNRQQNVGNLPPVPPVEAAVRPPSPKRSLLSPPRTAVPPSRNYNASSFSLQTERRQQSSPPRRRSSPPRHQPTSSRHNPHSDIFQRRPVNQQQSTQKSTEFTRRAISPPRREHGSGGRAPSPTKRFSDNWAPSGGLMQQGNWNQQQQVNQLQQRPPDRNMPEKRWSNERSQNWNNSNSTQSNQRFRYGTNQDKRGNDAKEGTWMSGGGDVWNAKPAPVKPTMDRQWGGGANDGQGPSGDRWNVRGNDAFGQMNNRANDWGNSGKGDKDWTDLPDDAKDPWADNNGSSGKPRWQPSEKTVGSNWVMGDEVGNNWSNKSNIGNWQNKDSSSPANTNTLFRRNTNNQNNNQQQWMPQNNATNFGTNNWRPQNYSGFSQQPRQNTFGFNSFQAGR